MLNTFVNKVSMFALLITYFLCNFCVCTKVFTFHAFEAGYISAKKENNESTQGGTQDSTQDSTQGSLIGMNIGTIWTRANYRMIGGYNILLKFKLNHHNGFFSPLKDKLFLCMPHLLIGIRYLSFNLVIKVGFIFGNNEKIIYAQPTIGLLLQWKLLTRIIIQVSTECNLNLRCWLINLGLGLC